jgi:hypothetical protein
VGDLKANIQVMTGLRKMSDWTLSATFETKEGAADKVRKKINGTLEQLGTLAEIRSG